jgi:hypothetical protein
MNERDEFPAIAAYPSLGLSEAILDAARDAGIVVEIRGFALLESADPPSAGHFDLTPWLVYFTGVAGGLSSRILDGAVAEIGAELLRRFVQTVRDTIRRAPRKPFVTVRIDNLKGGRRRYNLPVVDLDAAAAAILEDVGLSASHPLDCARFWDEGRWIGRPRVAQA